LWIPPGNRAAMPISLPAGKDWSNANQDRDLGNYLGTSLGRCNADIV
jgi:hypothetical protein